MEINTVTKKIYLADWSHGMSTSVIKALQSKVFPLGYHICLGGGVLNSGTSKKDLDLFFLPLMGKAHVKQPNALLILLCKELFSKPYKIYDGQYEEKDAPCIWKGKFFVPYLSQKHLRIDVFLYGDGSEGELIDVYNNEEIKEEFGSKQQPTPKQYTATASAPDPSTVYNYTQNYYYYKSKALINGEGNVSKAFKNTWPKIKPLSSLGLETSPEPGKKSIIEISSGNVIHFKKGQ